ncbi:class II fumarate hydratase [Halobacillus naozhouensis]|uniref:Fumarate hydratase class II n=1 Tax=Halobacillus naozhouensis TaxID=554880 RepID=A0ABY8J430_9BACI|nr:class II fumarate hydratase [Halobacillus naozhouensis]WFT76822.1 class II fumarate hydratase [Halobacillus naozhouensis]
MDYRVEQDTLGEMKVPVDKLWAAQTQRSKENFKIGIEEMPEEVLKGFAVLKKSAALANQELGHLNADKAEAIVQASNEILDGKLYEHFPLKVWQTGSGTQSHMNINEVIANRGNQWLGKSGSEERLHPNDDVNLSQSSNCNFPTAMYIAGVTAIEDQVFPALTAMKETLLKKSEEYQDLVKVGRTHLQDAVPLTLGQEISAWHRMMEKTEDMIQESNVKMEELAFAGTAVGTGLNTYKAFPEIAVKKISSFTGKRFVPASNKFHALTSYDEVVYCHGALKALASDLMKLANDIRWLASGPRSGIGEITITANEPGSSMMPGKVNPTQCEALTMVATQVIGNDVTVGLAASQGNFQVNVFKPVIAYNFLQSARLLADGMISFNKNCLKGLKPNEEVIKKNLDQSLMLVTVLNPHIGYENAAKIAKTAHDQGLTLKEAAVQTGLLTEEVFDEIVNPINMTHPKSLERTL